MFEHSFKLVKANVLPYQKHIRRFLIFAVLFMLIVWLFGIYIGIIGNITFVFVIVAFIVNQISIQRVKQIGTFVFKDEKYEICKQDVVKEYDWNEIEDVSFSKIHTTIYKLTFDKKSFFLDLNKTELMSLEDFLESKGFMEDSKMSFFHK